jgi:hypothetical protein
VGETDLAERVRAICLALPEVTEKPSHGSPAFFATKQFVMLWPDGHHGNHFPHLWCAAPDGAQSDLISRTPERFFRPPYVGGRGWIGVRLDGAVDWTEIEDIVEDAYRVTAPKRLVAKLDEDPPVRCADGTVADRTDGQPA